MSQPTNNVYGLQEGSSVEQLSEYKPEALGRVELEAGEAEQRWEDYALELVPVRINGADSGKRAIMRNGAFLEMVSDQYKLVPNEEVVHAAEAIADDLGAKRFDEFDGDWFIKLEDHVFQDEDGRRVHALYAWDDPVDVGHGDDVQLGYAVHNSIDRSMGLQVSLFSFRHACANMIFMGVGGEGMNFDQRDVLTHSARKHTHGLEVDNLKAWIESTVEYAPAVIDAYQRWQDQALERGQVERLVALAQQSRLSRRKDVPGWVKAAVEALDDAEAKAEENQQLGDEQFVSGLPPEARANIIEAHTPEAATVWDTYNDLTQNIWHSEDTNDEVKRRKMKLTHRVFQPEPDDAGYTLR